MMSLSEPPRSPASSFNNAAADSPSNSEEDSSEDNISLGTGVVVLDVVEVGVLHVVEVGVLHVVEVGGMA